MRASIPIVLAALALVALVPLRAAAAEPEPVFQMLAQVCLAGDSRACEDAAAWAPDEALRLWLIHERARMAGQRHDAASQERFEATVRQGLERLERDCLYQRGAACDSERVALALICAAGDEQACLDLAAQVPGEGGAQAARRLGLALQAAAEGAPAGWDMAVAPVTSERERRLALHAAPGEAWSGRWDVLDQEQALVTAVLDCDAHGAAEPATCLALARTVNGPSGTVPTARVADLAGEMCAQDRRSSACAVHEDLIDHRTPADPALTPAALLLGDQCRQGGVPRACWLQARVLELGRLTLTGRHASREALRLACEEGQREACFTLEEIYRDGLAPALDGRCDAGSAGGGDPAACHELGMAQRSGAGLVRNPGTATARLRWGCDQGYAPSCEALAGVDRARSLWDAAAPEVACEHAVVAACGEIGRGWLEGTRGEVPAPRYGEALLLAACRAGDGRSCVDLARHYQATAAEQPARAGWGRYLVHHACVAGDEAACAELERLGPGPSEPPPMPGPSVKPPPPPPPPPDPPPYDPPPYDPPPRRPRPPDIRDVGGIGMSVGAGTVRSWSADTQASVLRTGAELVLYGLGVGGELEHVTDYRFRPKEGRTYQRFTMWGHGMVRLPFADTAHLTFGGGPGLGSYRHRREEAVFSGAFHEFLEVDVVVVDVLRFAIRVEQRQYLQFHEEFHTDHATGVLMTVGMYGEP